MDSRTSYMATSDAVSFDRAPVLVAGLDPDRSPVRTALEQVGWRTAPTSLAALPQRLAVQGRMSALFVDTAGCDDLNWEQLLEGAMPMGRWPVLFSGGIEAVDRMSAFADRVGADVLVDPTDLDVTTAMALATADLGGSASVHDVASEPSAARLRQLSDEVGRIAATLARLSSGPAPVGAELPAAMVGNGVAPSVSGEQVRAVIRARRMRARYFDSELFADPAWDMLLDLLQAEIAQHRVPVSSLCIAAAVPPTTALRWIKTMTDVGLFRRRADPHDGRRVFVELSADASGALRRYFADVGAVAAA